MFLRLPNEVLTLIFDYLGTDELACLQATCQTFRQLLISQFWEHVHVIVGDATTTTNSGMLPYIRPYCNCGTQFIKNHCCRKMYIQMDAVTIREFCESLLNGHIEVLKYVRLLTIDMTCYLPTSVSEPQSVAQLYDLQDHVIFNWFLKYIPDQMANLQRIDIHTELNTPAMAAGGLPLRPALHELIRTIPKHVQVNLDYEATRQWQDLQDKLDIWSCRCQVRILNLVLRFPDDNLHNTRLIFGKRIPDTVEKLLISERLSESSPIDESYTGIKAEAFRDFVSSAPNLQSLTMYARIDNKNNIKWLPDSVTELAMDDSSISYETEFAAPNVRSFTAMVSAVGSECILNYFKFGNLTRLFVNFYLGSHELLHPGHDLGHEADNLQAAAAAAAAAQEQQEQPQQPQQQHSTSSSEMHRTLATLVAQNPGLLQVRTVGLPYRLVKPLIAPNLQSLIVHNASDFSGADLISLARCLPSHSLTVCALDMASITAYRQFVDTIGALLNQCKQLSSLYLYTTDDYMGVYDPVPYGAFYDGHSLVMYPDVRLLDIPKFIAQYNV